jgi:hypothetical protein
MPAGLGDASGPPGWVMALRATQPGGRPGTVTGRHRRHDSVNLKVTGRGEPPTVPVTASEVKPRAGFRPWRATTVEVARCKLFEQIQSDVQSLVSKPVR